MRKIIHVDMDAFYASVEQRDNPSYRGKPIVVGGPPNSRGVVSTCSYEARVYGIHSAMPSTQAYKLCPHAIFVSHHNFSKYKEASDIIREIFLSYTDLVEPLSLDEAYLDVTENKMNNPSATRIAEEIRARIYKETNLTASAGVSYNKFIAKIASDIDKPNGLTVILPEEAESFLAKLPIKKFWGVGKKTAEHMNSLGIETGADLKKLEMYECLDYFGKSGSYYYNAVRGIDERNVEPERTRKSLGRENTFPSDLTDPEEIMKELEEISARIEEDLKQQNLQGRQLTLKVKYHDFRLCTRSIQSPMVLENKEDILSLVPALLNKTDAGKIPVRLLGLSLGKLQGDLYKEADPQMELNLFAADSGCTQGKSL
ncbi:MULTISPECIES: DNA polymerase IV [unclassified Oceanispirochaeta]|uniref:DNA polymerase IV n=1 Tax=unclassified Oceanispirochaeta TaxID=2635722 RepID=UPI000E099ACF|nr:MULTISPECIES: DNA polymerase IV [unclassified Oceanispirochaeta]MBF9017198.1 DNA polymerase IV [Oceanispirochaeta sp. M2]NPD73647.1 DNA polymerase IV [Oceanispirochaeta sp. M1]RDG30577.1 DNA polymerase IV [Oceanispirochaeta sp. M1]